MTKLAKIIASVCGIGFVKKGGGTLVSVVYCVIWLLLPELSIQLGILLIIFILIAGVWSATRVEKIWGKDNYRIVIDEVAGMMIPLVLLPREVKYLLAALVLFRLFDILKPLGIKKMEKLNAGWGVMADDILAGIYTLVILHLAITIKLL
jgi:phosphatidylglycerophosphatase A